MRRSRARRALLLPLLLAACGTEGLPDDGPGRGRFVVDAASLIVDDSESRMNDLLDALLDDADIELVAVTVDSLGGEPIERFANDLFERWEVGSRTRANRGLLLVVAQAEERVRFEVAYDLEAIFPDAFVSYIEREQMVPYFADGAVGHGTEATTELIARRAFERVLGRAYDPEADGDDDIGGFRSGGAGAQSDVAFSGGTPREAAPDEVRVYFDAQPTAERAWQRFVEANRRRIKDPELGIYDREAKAIMRRTVTNAGQDHIADLYGEADHEVRQRGDRAVVLFRHDPNHLLAPWFFHRTARGWQLDGSMYPGVVGYNHRNQWRFRSRDHAYMFAFEDFRFDDNGFAFPR